MLGQQFDLSQASIWCRCLGLL